MEGKEHYTIVFNLFILGTELYLPSAYIVKLNSDKKSSYIQQKAIKETITSFTFEGINLAVIHKLLSINELLMPEKIVQHIHPSAKKGKPIELEVLMKDLEISKKIKTM